MVYLTLLLTFVLYFVNFGLSQVWSPNEAFYAYATYKMLETGNFLTPEYNGGIRLNKPPMTYWLVAIGYSLLGVNEWGLRFVHVILGLLTGLVVALFALEAVKDKVIAVYAYLSFSLSLMVFANAHYASPEMPFTFFITLSLYLWYLGYNRMKNLFIVLAFLSSSLAMLVKGPAGFVIPAGTVFLYLLITNPKELLKLKYYLLSAVSLALGLWWHLYQILTRGKVFWDVFYRENIKRIYAGSEPIYTYFLDLLFSFLPYSFIFFFALFWVILQRKREYSFFLVWFGFTFGLFSLIKQKIPVYVMPAYPALAIITAGFLKDESLGKLRRYSFYFLTLLILLASYITILYFELQPWLLLLSIIPIFSLWKKTALSPAFSMLFLIAVLKLGVLPKLEHYRPYREIGNYINQLDPNKTMKVYQVGHFNHSLPFYARREVVRNQEPQKGSIVLYKEGSFSGCKVLKTYKLYVGSESRFFRFLMDTKKGKRFETFHLCLY